MANTPSDLTRYRDFFENTMEGIAYMEFDPPIPTTLPIDEQIDLGYERGRHVEWNSIFASQYGYSPDDDLTLVNLDSHLPKDDERNQDFLRHFFNDGYRSHSQETFEKDRFGNAKVFLNSWIGIIEDDHLVSVWGAMMDITAFKRAERALRQAQKMEAIWQLTGGIAHDFNNILACIVGFTQLARTSDASKDSPELAEYLEQVHQASLRGRDLVAQMLSFGRRQDGSIKITNADVLAKSVADLLTPILPASIDFALEAAPDLPAISIDPVQLEQALINLCINARDAIDGDGSITLELDHVRNLTSQCASCESQVSGEFVRISVTDSGAGIPPAVVSKIFEPFYSSKSEGEGSGMGLTMVHGITHAHGGHIEVTSGQGTTFSLLFPPGALDDEAQTGIRESRGRRPKANILVVEDQQSVGALIGQVLENHGFSATVLNDSRQALEYFQEHGESVDLVITDQSMPAMTGAELSKKLLELRSELPIIVCSGYGSSLDEEAATKIGIRGFQSKPFEIDDFVNLVDRLLGPDD